MDLKQLLSIIQEAKTLLVVTHDNPDPDALASAFALKRLARAKCGVRPRVCCEGIVGRAENRALARELDFHPLEAAKLDWNKWPVVALVDAQPGTGNNSFPPRRVPDIVIDHHPQRRRTRGRYLDIRPDHGACATIMAEYLFAADVPISSSLAAALCYAIASETQDLARQADPADVAAYVRLYPNADKRMLGRVLHPKLEHDYFTTLARAILGASIYANIVISHLGKVDHPDSVSLVADLLLRHQRTSWCIATGICQNTLYVSLRTTHPRSHAGHLLRRVLKGRGRAGGHDTLAGGQVPLNGLDEKSGERLQDEIVNRFIHLLKRREDAVLRPFVPFEELGSC